MKPKYTAKVIQEIENGPGYWKYLTIGIFDQNGKKIGEYRRNYSSFMDTFCWFTSGGKDYALYSKDYVATRIMSLPDCKDIGGEPSHSSGFCPTGFYVPGYVEYQFKPDAKPASLAGEKFCVYEPEKEGYDSDDTELSKPFTHLPFGFVSGCVWGDDSSWKIEYLDLSRAPEGILKREARFGYIELPSKMKLQDAIDVENYEENDGHIIIATQSCYNVKTGKRLE